MKDLCTCGHDKKKHFQNSGCCDKCGCTWFHPKDSHGTTVHIDEYKDGNVYTWNGGHWMTTYGMDLYECDVECVEDSSLEDILTPDQNSIPLKASFFLKDVEMWKETGYDEYPCRVYTSQGRSYGLWKVTYSEFTKVMKGFLGIIG